MLLSYILCMKKKKYGFDPIIRSLRYCPPPPPPPRVLLFHASRFPDFLGRVLGGGGALTRGNFALRRCPISGEEPPLAPKAAVGLEPRKREVVQLLQLISRVNLEAIGITTLAGW
jgi:hypothetical protein